MLRYRSSEDVKLVIDDNDPLVKYSGEWGNERSYATYFQAYDLTMHYTLQHNANASISFYGSYITVFGIIPSNSDLINAGFNKEESQLQSSYQFDNGPPVYFNVTLDAHQHFTDQVFFQPNLTQSDDYHTLLITNLTGMLALDYFTIVPANSGSNSYQKIDDTSPNITYNNAKPLSSITQADFNSTVHSLSSLQSSASLDFNGNLVAVYGALPSGNSLPDVSFTLDNIDQSVPTRRSDPSGSMPRLPAFRKQRLSQVLFWKSPMLSNGQHNLLITVTQGEFWLDFILIQTPHDAGTGSTVSSQSHKPTMPQIATASSTNAPSDGSAMPSSPASLSPHDGTPSDHTGNTSGIVGGAVGGAVGFVLLILALYMIRIVFKRRSGLRSTTQSDTESSSQPPVQTVLPVTTIATAGTPYLVDSSGQLVMGYILGPPIGPVPPPYQPRDETHEGQIVPAEINEGGKDVAQEVLYGHDDKFAMFGQAQRTR